MSNIIWILDKKDKCVASDQPKPGDMLSRSLCAPLNKRHKGLQI